MISPIAAEAQTIIRFSTMLPQPITDVYPFDKQCAFNVDYEGQEYRVCWSGDWRRQPNLSSFPRVDGVALSPIPHSSEVDELWTASRVVGHGSDSHLRELNNCTDGFPICKVAINERQKRLLQEEFSLLRHLSTLHLSLPIVRICLEPFQDEQGIFGFRMEKLYGITLEDLLQYFDEMDTAIKRIHQAGVIHYDISISNIMLNVDGRITLIDFGRSGYIGDQIPLIKEKGVKPTGEHTYAAYWDFQALRKIQGKS
ncbi:kinase-like domain-containing protein [Thelonectria olida]|uniref:EKC/KEOPS complex subunit BUD32 n=1 Tax=Thelonectria olida TaxID=1576542 RepID=A0A9P9AI28_9HYPO|nr:kinase-like domain-containing protein [Thelonectria olida]